jgi:hypothetical protein
MNRTRIARELLAIVKSLMGVKVVQNPMNGLRKQQVIKAINELITPYTKGIHRDNHWRPVQDIRKALDKAGLDWNFTDNEYQHDDQGRPNGKKWEFEVRFMNERGRAHVLTGRIIASGAGTVEDPLESYDITAYVS